MNKIILLPALGSRYFCTVRKLPKTAQRLVPALKVKSSIDLNKLPPKTKIDSDTVSLLERLSLVDCESKEAIEILEAKLRFADQILQVDTSNVTPMITPLEDIPLRVREDEVTDDNCRDQVLKGAAVLEEEYFVAPPGNIPLETREDLQQEQE